MYEERTDRPALALQLATSLVYAQTISNINSRPMSGRKPLSKTVIEVADDLLAWLDNKYVEPEK